jgi:hypothetical protein
MKTTSEEKKKNSPNQIKPTRLSQNLVATSLISDVLFINHLHLY